MITNGISLKWPILNTIIMFQGRSCLLLKGHLSFHENFVYQINIHENNNIPNEPHEFLKICLHTNFFKIEYI